MFKNVEKDQKQKKRNGISYSQLNPSISLTMSNTIIPTPLDHFGKIIQRFHNRRAINIELLNTMVAATSDKVTSHHNPLGKYVTCDLPISTKH